MPPLVARQWKVLRGAPAITGLLCRTQQLSRPTFVATRRSCAQQSKPNEKQTRQPVPLNGAILIPASVPDAQPAEVIQSILPVVRERVAKESFCVFLVTPSFAPWLLKDEVFLQKALVRTYGELWKESHKETPMPSQIHALCAVVDKLPAGRAFKSGATVEDELSRRTKQPPVAQPGFEGIAYVTLPVTASVSSNAPSSSEKGAIDFIVSERKADGERLSDVVRLPLANTVFQTGKPTTMMLSSWEPCHTTERLQLISKTDLSYHGIRIAGRDQSIDCIMSSLSIPLIPLTVARRVEGCMGNIIRRIISSEGESVTASSELEKVVPQFFKSRGEPAQATIAWALVLPQALAKTTNARTMRLLANLLTKSEKGENKQVERWERLWRSDPPLWNTLVSTALAEGARLHRVLSGGGGWGKKAGLLSLDPVPISEVKDQPSSDGFPSMFGDPEDFASTLTPVVQDGDFIQFYVLPNSKIDTEAGQVNGLEDLAVLPKNDAWGWELGTIPSTVDSMPGGSWQHTSSASENVSVFRNSFGALAEGGLTLTRRFETKDGESGPSVGTTVVDVPFSRFWAVEVVGKVSSTEDVANSYFEKD
ncbi:Nn.00g001740.m01.CDS01 [Neocucurbitaria sp. VM-36]